MATGVGVVCLPLPPLTRQNLIARGYISTKDLADVSALDLAADLQIEPSEALAILRAAGCINLGQDALEGSKTGVDVLAKERSARKILTFCGDLDKILDGGIATSQITEFCGAPGVGKTQIGMQLAMDVQIPIVFGGLESEALYIDTEGSFLLDRARQMAEAFVKHMKRMPLRSNTKAPAVEDMTWEGVLDKIHLIRALDLSEQLAAMHNLEAFVGEHPKVKLVVIDSLTFHLRQDLQDMAHRTRMLAQLAQDMMRLASDYNLAVVLMNHMTTKIAAQQTRLVPALGDSWAHAATNRIILFWRDQQRVAFLFKSPSLPATSAEYFVTSDGVRGKEVMRARQNAQKRAKK